MHDLLRIEPAGPADAGELLTLQRAAYVTEAQLYDDPHLPPLTQTLDELRADLLTWPTRKAVLGARIVGTARARADGEVLHVGRLSVAPDLQGRGIGTALLEAVERLAGPEVRRAALFTGRASLANVRLYERCGYTVTGYEDLPVGPGIVHLEKALSTGQR
jgi:GNAT superfamily N-acetyltransferase